MLVESLESGDEFAYVFFPFLVDVIALACHFFLHEGKQFGVRLFLLLQECVALLENFVVACQAVEVRQVVLGYDDVHESSSLFASASNEHLVGGRDEDEWNKSDVLSQSAVGFLSPAHYLLLSVFQSAMYFFFGAILSLVDALQGHHLLAVHDGGAVEVCRAALAEGEEVYCIQQIRLAFSVESDETIHASREVNFCQRNVFVIQY